MSFFARIDVSEKPFDGLFGRANEPVLVMSTGGTVVYANRSAKRTFPELRPDGPADELGAFDPVLRKSLERIGRNTVTVPLRVDHVDGPVWFKAWRVEVDEIEVEGSLVLLFGDSSADLRAKFLGLKVEVNEKENLNLFERRRTRQLHKEALHLRQLVATDNLTGLATAAEMEKVVDTALGGVVCAGAVIFIDLDGFKPINDTYGHVAGDEVLQCIGRRIASVARYGDVSARLGGDEFGLWCRDATYADALRVIDRLRSALAPTISFKRNGELPLEVTVGASIGYACYPDDGTEFAELKDVADRRMYADKALRKGDGRATMVRRGSVGNEESPPRH